MIKSIGLRVRWLWTRVKFYNLVTVMCSFSFFLFSSLFVGLPSSLVFICTVCSLNIFYVSSTILVVEDTMVSETGLIFDLIKLYSSTGGRY